MRPAELTMSRSGALDHWRRRATPPKLRSGTTVKGREPTAGKSRSHCGDKVFVALLPSCRPWPSQERPPSPGNSPPVSRPASRRRTSPGRPAAEQRRQAGVGLGFRQRRRHVRQSARLHRHDGNTINGLDMAEGVRPNPCSPASAAVPGMPNKPLFPGCRINRCSLGFLSARSVAGASRLAIRCGPSHSRTASPTAQPTPFRPCSR